MPEPAELSASAPVDGASDCEASPVTRWAVDVDRIERARVLNAWTRKHLASVAHVDPKTLADMCSGRRRPTLGTVQAICSALGLVVADVITFLDDANRGNSADSRL
jgi:DNA-binding XRE family transcriptional regulator